MARTTVTAAALVVTACAFDPVVRRVDPERVGEANVALVRTLDLAGAYVLVQPADAGPDASQRAVLHWRSGTRCSLPAGLPHVLRPLRAPSGAGGGARPFVLPIMAEGADDDDHVELQAIDHRCRTLGSLGTLRPGSVQARSSASDGRGIMFALDAQRDLVVFDPYRSERLQTVARSVDRFWPFARAQGDAVWVLASGRVALVDLAGQVERVLGTSVSEFALDARSGRVAFVDGGALLVADAPGYAPRKLADDACALSFAAQALYALAPCADERLLGLYPGTSSPVRYEEGVVAALRQGELELLYGEAGGAPTMSAQLRGGPQRALDPPLRPDRTYPLRDGSLFGLTADGRFGVHAASGEPFRVWFERVSDLRASYRGKSHAYWFVAYHHADAGLGALSGLSSDDQRVWTFAEGVPAASVGGYLLDSGAAFPNDPFPEPVLVSRGDSSDDGATGTLRAALVSGRPMAELGAGVDEYLLVSTPLPGLLYRISEGAERGLWYVPL